MLGGVAPIKPLSAAVVTSIFRAPEAGRDVGRNVFVKVKTNRHRSGCLFQTFLAQFRFEHGWMPAAEFLRKRTLLPHLLLGLVNVIEVICEASVDVGESDRR